MTFIDTYWARFGAEPICAVLSEHGISIAPSTYYARRSMPVTSAELEDTYLANLLVTLHREIWSAYGVRKLRHAARRQGLELGRVQVDRLMGIAGVVRGRHTTRTTRREEKAARHPNLVQRSWDALTGPDQLWVADFSYVWTLAGFVYVAFVVDAFSRRISGLAGRYQHAHVPCHRRAAAGHRHPPSQRRLLGSRQAGLSQRRRRSASTPRWP